MEVQQLINSHNSFIINPRLLRISKDLMTKKIIILPGQSKIYSKILELAIKPINKKKY